MLCEKCGIEYFNCLRLTNDSQVCEDCVGFMKRFHEEIDSFEWFINNKWMFNIDIEPEIQYENYIKKLNKIIDNKRYYFMTIAHRKHSKNKFDFTDENIEKFRQFCQKFVGVTQENIQKSGFLEEMGFPLKSAIYFVESGKDEDCPKLHSHFILDFKNNKNPNLSRSVRECFNKYFSENKILEKDEYHNIPFTEIYMNDKLHYVINCYKDEHENFKDLEINGGFGHLWMKLENL
jgi:hypothetical protein